MKNNLEERFLAILSLLLIAIPLVSFISGKHFYPWLFKVSDESDTHQVVAKAAHLVGDVKQQSYQTGTTNTVPPNGEFRINDLVMTGPGSSVVLKLNDGGELLLDENTMIKLAFENQLFLNSVSRTWMVQVLSGQVKASARTQKIILKSDQKPPTLVLKDQSKVLKSEVKKAEVKNVVLDARPLKEPDPPPTVPVVTQPVTQPVPTPAQAHKKLPLKIKKPLVLVKIKTEPPGIKTDYKNFSVYYKWYAVPEAKEYRVCFSDFSSHQVQCSNWSPHTEAELYKNKPFVGKVKIRVEGKAQEGDLVVSLWNEMESRLERPILTSPSDGQSIKLNQSVLLAWSKTFSAHKYQVEIATDIHFQNITQKEVVPENVFLYKPTHEGAYYWRVTALTEPQQLQTTSRVGNFSGVIH